MLELENVSFGFSPNHVLFENVSFLINKGESLRLEGDNGAGKTTLLNCITQFKKIKSGDILVENKSIINKQPYKLWNLGIRRLFQDRLVFDNMTVKEQLYLTNMKGNHWFSIPKESDLEEIINILPYLKKILNRNAMLLSGGEKMLVGLSMILKTNPRLLILDEPFNALSTENRYYFIEILNDIKNSGVSILIVDHDKYFKTDNSYIINRISNNTPNFRI